MREIIKFLKSLVPIRIKVFIKNFYTLVNELSKTNSLNFAHIFELHRMWLDIKSIKKNQENIFNLKYVHLGKQNQRSILKDNEFKIYSQNGEDGLILYIFSEIGITNSQFIEFGAGGTTSNTANLIINFGWSGLLIDGNRHQLNKLSTHYVTTHGVDKEKIKTANCWLTHENINETFREYDFYGEIDLLSIDVDGNDYWLWKSISEVNPRLVIIEYNASLGPELSLSIKYNPNFYRHLIHPWYHGASLKALQKLGDNLGYSLIGCESNGINAFFLRKDLLCEKLKKQSVADCYYPHALRYSDNNWRNQYQNIKDFEYIEI